MPLYRAAERAKLRLIHQTVLLPKWGLNPAHGWRCHQALRMVHHEGRSLLGRPYPGVAGNAGLVTPFTGDGIGIHRDQPGWEMAFAQCYELASRLARFDTKSMAPEANSFPSPMV
jgi:hypothetical protein